MRIEAATNQCSIRCEVSEFWNSESFVRDVATLSEARQRERKPKHAHLEFYLPG